MICHHGGTTSKALHCSSLVNLTRHLSASAAIGDHLLVGSIAKALCGSGSGSGAGGTSNLDADSIPLTENLVLKVLRRNFLHASKKLEFFHWCSLNPNYKHSAKTYSEIFRTICFSYHHNQLLDESLDLLTSMKKDEIVLDSATLKLLLDAFIRLEKFDSALEILDLVEKEFGIGTNSSCLNPDLYNSVLVALVRKSQLPLVLSILFKLLDYTNVDVNVPNQLACNELFVGLRKADMRAEFKRVFNKLREKSRFPLDNKCYNICIHAFGCWGDLGASLALFKEMRERSLHSGDYFSPDLRTYNSLLHALLLAGKVNDALIVLEELKGCGHEPDSFTYRILIQGCSKSYRISDAMKMFSEMQYNGFRPDTFVYNSLLDGLLKARKLTDACHMFEKMTDEGVRPSCWTYNILIDGLVKNGRAAAGYALFCNLKKKGQLVDGVTYSIVILNMCREGELEEALHLVEEMEARGFVVDLVTITSLLIVLYRQGRWDWTERLLKHIRDDNFVPIVLNWKAAMEASMKDPQSRHKDFTSMFTEVDFTDVLKGRGSESSGPQDEETSSHESDQWSPSPYMDLLAYQAVSNDYSFQTFSLTRGKRVQSKGIESFDIDMVNTYLSIFLAKGKLSLACKLFEVFTSMGVEPVSYTYNSMISSFVKKGYVDEAWGIFHEMKESFCPADIATYNLVIQGLGRMGRADLVVDVLDQLMKRGGYVDIVMYNTLINALGKAGLIDEANRLFQQLRTSGIKPDIVTYNTLIEVHSKAGRLKDAYRFLKMMLDAGCSPNHVTDTILDFMEKEIEKWRYAKASIRSGSKGNSF